MGKPSSPESPPPYRDDPSMDDALSMHTTQGESDHVPQFNPDDTLALPPRYSDNEAELPTFDENVFAGGSEGVIWKANSGKINVCHPAYDRNPVYLQESIRKWSKIPPSLHVRILGNHSQKVKKGDKTETEKVTDFDMKIRLTEYFMTHGDYAAWTELSVALDEIKTYRGTVLKSRGKHPPGGLERAPPTLMDWCEEYCENKTTLKRFNFVREVGGLDMQSIRDNLTSLIRNTNYRGNLHISFPIDNPGLEIYSYHWVNKARNSMIAIILSVITAMIIIIWPIMTLMTKRYEVVKTVWWFSKLDNNDCKVYATISETAWFNKWAKCIEKNALRHRQGLLTLEDLARVDEPVSEVNTGNTYLDAAAGMVGAGIHAYREVNRQVGWGYDC